MRSKLKGRSYKKRKFRILHVIPNFKPGGAERLLINLLDVFDKEKFEIAAVSLFPEMGTILEEEIKEKGYKVYFLNKHRGLDLRMFLRIYSVLKNFKPDVVHTHLYVMRYTLIPTFLNRVPVLVHTVHNVAQKEVTLLGKIIHKFAFKWLRVIPISISQEVTRTIKIVYGKAIRTYMIYNGIPTSKFFLRSDKKNKKGNIILLHVGSFKQQKNHMLLIEAFSLVAKEHSNIYLWLVGNGELRQFIENAVNKKRLNEKVTFLGIRNDVAKLLNKCNIFILSSDWEGMPLTILEAMASGKPVVSTAVGGVPELVKNGVTGLLVPPSNSRALAKAIIQLSNNNILCSSMGEKGRKRVVEQFDISKTAKKYEDLYKVLLKEKK